MKRLLIAILTIMLLSGLAFAGNKSGFMTTDQKDALDGADTPSASNVLATIKDVEEQDSGVQTVTPGVNLSNSGDADNPILDLNISEDIDMNTSYQLKHLAAPAADGEAIRQTSKLTESSLESGIDRLNELEETDTPQFASVNVAGNYQFPQAIGSSGEALKVPAAGSLLEWGSAGGVAYAQTKVVAKSGGDFTTITAALNDISDADSVVRYAIKVYPGDYDETVTCKEFVDIIGTNRHTCRIAKSDGIALNSSNNCTIENLSLITTNATTDVGTVVLQNDSDTFVMRNCDMESITNLNGHIYVIKATGSQDRYLQLYNCKVYGKNSHADGEVICVHTGRRGFISEYCDITAWGGSNSDYTVALYCNGYNASPANNYIRKTRIEVIGASSASVECVRFASNQSCYVIDSELFGSSGTRGFKYSSGTVNLYLKNVYEQRERVAGSINFSYLKVPALGIENTPAGNIAATDVQSAINELDDEKADIAGDDTITGLWRFDSLVLTPKAIADSPASPQEGHFWMESTAVDSGPNIYHGGEWKRLLTDADHNGGLTYISTSGTVTVDTGLEYQKVSGGTIAYTADHLHNFTHSAGTLTYIGTRTLHFTLTAHASLESGETAQEVSIRLAKNGSTIAGTDMETTFTAQNAHQSSSTKWLDELSTNDYIEVFATSDQSADEVIFNNMILIITEH